MNERMRIGEVADRTGLSLRTIRAYDEAGLVKPSIRSKGGFRLYTESDATRLNLARCMKTLGFSKEEIRDVLDLLTPISDETAKPRWLLAAHHDKLRKYSGIAEERCVQLRTDLNAAESVAALLRGRLSRPSAEAL